MGKKKTKTSGNSQANEPGNGFVLGLFFISSLMVFIISLFLRDQIRRSETMLIEATQNHLESAAQGLSTLFSVEELDLYHAREDTKTGEYAELKKHLVSFAKTNNLLYAYYWRRYGDNQLQYIIDNDFNTVAEVGPWEIIDISENIAVEALAGNVVVTDLTAVVPTWDGLITAYAPVFDSQGNVYCVAGVDISHNNLYLHRMDERRMTFILLLSIALTILSGVNNVILYRRRARQIHEAHVELAREKDVIQTMKDNLDHGIFLMDRNLNVLPQYSSAFATILSYYDSDLSGKNFLSIINTSFNNKELNLLKDYFSMIFAKEKSKKVLDAANPIAEFKYKVNNKVKYLSAKFQLIEPMEEVDQRGVIRKDSSVVYGVSGSVILGIIQDISREKEIEIEFQTQKENKEVEFKNMFDIIKIDPRVFHEFVEDTEDNFEYINAILKDSYLSENEVVARIYQYIHAIKSNAIILELENLANKLIELENYIKNLSNNPKVFTSDILTLAVKLESVMREVDSYIAITGKIGAYKTTEGVDTLLINSLSKTVERLASESNIKADIKAEQIDLSIMESQLSKPIKDILFQCVRNSIHHGIESVEERIKKNKKPRGLLTFSVKNNNGRAEVIYTDDGRGLDWEKIKDKYLETRPDVINVDRKDLLGAIFADKFTTADNANFAAGRGVGLSLVRNLVKENNGQINVNSTESSLTFKFSFPLADIDMPEAV